MTTRRVRERHAMVDRQIIARGITDTAILAAFREVPRELFVEPGMEESAYADGPLPIGEGQTISQPFIVASMIDAADVKRGDRVLEVGAGSGYAAAVLSRIAKSVFAIERHAVLVQRSRERIDHLGYDNCSILSGDGTKGLLEEAPFDAILVAARIEAIPEALKRQLEIGGTLVIPVGGEDVQQLQSVVRTGEESWRSRDITPVRFVPLLEGVVGEAGTGATCDQCNDSKRERA
ncbi:protein-L-isoaspartate(D-aspartate) O-methyltransferase [Erythrobacter sp. QSSC1-22B]|uniref:protein-L-isoaspartate(D-aspartate) O-methyltransferase n=1 Tax=Erythrobacter sp. QSSC1-22B TaxID=1860125 RepID=UPI0009F40E0A|nr:protein-L-isoaspartate(D-aspartate) O-methyltransferase [Erythrobacter sp. QSSC1-22B]